MFDFVSFIPRAVVQGIPLLLGSTGETLTEKSGNLNLGIPGIRQPAAARNRSPSADAQARTRESSNNCEGGIPP